MIKYNNDLKEHLLQTQHQQHLYQGSQKAQIQQTPRYFQQSAASLMGSVQWSKDLHE